MDCGCRWLSMTFTDCEQLYNNLAKHLYKMATQWENGIWKYIFIFIKPQDLHCEFHEDQKCKHDGFKMIMMTMKTAVEKNNNMQPMNLLEEKFFDCFFSAAVLLPSCL